MTLYYYRETYRKSLSDYFQTLVRQGRLNPREKDVYALTDGAKQELEKTLAG